MQEIKTVLSVKASAELDEEVKKELEDQEKPEKSIASILEEHKK